MAANAIYFPYIDVRPEPWLLRVLLYWDQLRSIVPMEFQRDLGKYQPHMRNLVSAGLVQPVWPGQYMHQVDGFADDFLRYAERWRQKHAAARAWPQTRIHAEKLYQLIEPLVAMNLAHPVDGSWYDMPAPIASHFMASLAAALGRIEEIDAAPITNSAPLGRSLWNTHQDARRDALLKILFPMPGGSEKMTLDDIVAFKAGHQALATRFRERVEQECMLMANSSTPQEHQDRIQALGKRLQEEVDEITDAMQGRWKRIVFGQILPILAPAIPLVAEGAPKIGTIVGAAAAAGVAVYQSALMHTADQVVRRRPLAYVAFAQGQFPALRPWPPARTGR